MVSYKYFKIKYGKDEGKYCLKYSLGKEIVTVIVDSIEEVDKILVEKNILKAAKTK